MIERGFTTNRFLTFRQALELGGNVRKGERGMTVVYAHRYTRSRARTGPRGRPDARHDPVPEAPHGLFDRPVRRLARGLERNWPSVDRSLILPGAQMP